MPLHNFGLKQLSIGLPLVRCAQPDLDGLDSLVLLAKEIGASGVKVYKLNAGEDPTVPPDADLGAPAFMQTIPCPLGWPGPPSMVDLMQILGSIRADLEALYLVVLHCAQGQDRTGVVFAMLRMMIDGWTRQAAIAEATVYGVGHLNWTGLLDGPLFSVLGQLPRGATTP